MTPFSSRPTLPRLASALVAALIAAALPFSLFADALVWAKEKQHFDTSFGQDSVEAVYKFTNTSDRPVTITEATASCGCTVPSLDKKVYQPGESGELKAIFTLGSRQGEQRKTITVNTETGGEQNQYNLMLEVDIPVPVTLTPRVRFWSVGEQAEAQEVAISFNEKLPMEIQGLKRKDDQEPESFDYEIETVKEGLEYRLKITPKHPNAKSRDVFYLVSDDDKEDILRSFPIYVYVR